MKFITCDEKNRVLHIGLNRPDKMNAFNMQMLQELSEAYSLLEQRESLWCGLLFSHTDNFTAGLDLADVAPHVKAGAPLFPEKNVDPLRINGRELTKPMVVVLQGYCLTIGIELMLAADICIASEETKFGQIEVQRGIFPFGGATIRMVQRAGWGNAMRYLLTGDMFDAKEAYRTGMVQEVVNGHPFKKAVEIADTIAKQAPLGVYAILKSAHLSLTDEAGAKAALLATAEKLMDTEDAAEGLQSFLDRRKAIFTGR